jgi:hypothetical protein
MPGKELYLKPMRPDLSPAPVQIAYTVMLPSGIRFTMAKATPQVLPDFFRTADLNPWDTSVDGDGKKI